MRGLVSRLLPMRILNSLSNHAPNPGSSPWRRYYRAFPSGCGISTVSKLAYFHGLVFGGHRALILDSRLIDNTKRWTETAGLGLTYASAISNYPAYLNTMHATASNPALACTGDQLEFFLFALGNCF
jgi:hypothetical protein